MDRLGEFLEIANQKLEKGEFLGLLYILIGQSITTPDGTLLSTGLTWRETAAVLKKVRWKKEAVSDLGLSPGDLPPRDRVRYWYIAITRANVNSVAAREAGERLAKRLAEAGYVIGSAPTSKPS